MIPLVIAKFISNETAGDQTLAVQESLGSGDQSGGLATRTKSETGGSR